MAVLFRFAVVTVFVNLSWAFDEKLLREIHEDCGEECEKLVRDLGDCVGAGCDPTPEDGEGSKVSDGETSSLKKLVRDLVGCVGVGCEPTPEDGEGSKVSDGETSSLKPTPEDGEGSKVSDGETSSLKRVPEDGESKVVDGESAHLKKVVRDLGGDCVGSGCDRVPEEGKAKPVRRFKDWYYVGIVLLCLAVVGLIVLACWCRKGPATGTYHFNPQHDQYLKC